MLTSCDFCIVIELSTLGFRVLGPQVVELVFNDLLPLVPGIVQKLRRMLGFIGQPCAQGPST